MKKVILFLMFAPCLCYGQISFDFENGTTGGWIQGSKDRWSADTTQSISGAYSLHHVFDNPLSGSDCIGTPLTNLHPDEGTTRWSFRIRHGCDPSSSNSWAVYLMADKDPATFSNDENVNGYAAGVNLTGYDDTLRLWKITNGNPEPIASYHLNWQTVIKTVQSALVIAERSAEGNWILAVYDEASHLLGSSSFKDAGLFYPGWFIINYRYTSTRDRLLWLDDVRIEGVYHEDVDPPAIVACNVTGRYNLELVFSEDVPDDILKTSNLRLSNSGNTAAGITRVTGSSIRIMFRNELVNKEHEELIITTVCDMNGNCTNNLEVGFTPSWAAPGDIIISEIMADPQPPVALPPEEYIEIFNRTDFNLSTSNWNLSTGDQKIPLPGLTLGPGQYIILCALQDTGLFSAFGTCAGVKSFPSLTDEGRLLILSDSCGELIHGVEYSGNWYGDALKDGGGWSLEMIDTGYPFLAEGNWEASSSGKGGTPGTPNSVSRNNTDREFRGILNVFPVTENEIRVKFSEPLINQEKNLENSIIESLSVSTVTASDPLNREFILSLSGMITSGKTWSLSIPDDVTDFAGNLVEKRVFRFGIPVTAVKGDLTFNELLFNPFPEEPDWIEFFNRSGKILDASKIYLSSVNAESGDTSGISPLSAEERCLLPGTFYTITTSKKTVTTRYPECDPESLFEVSSLPSMPDDRGHLLLLNRQMEVIDEVIYTDVMHFPLLAATEGVSLEKLRPDLDSDESQNWHSASESSGWGTPGRENSLFTEEPGKDDFVNLSSGRISPDNDGYEDVLVIDLNLTGIGNVVSVTLFDETGNYVKKLCENLYAGNSASISWDGTAIDGSLVHRGIYILLIEIYDDKGKTRSWKKVVTVIR